MERRAGWMDERSVRMAERFEKPMVAAALLVIPVRFIEESSVGEPLDTIAVVLNWGIWLAFLAEAVVMLAVVPKRWEWVRAHPIEVIVVVLTGPLLPASLQGLRALRLLRLLRLVPLVRLGPRLFSAEGLRYTALLTVLTIFAGGTAYATLEDKPTAWDGVWWAVSTMTTVGYGDQYPETAAGRVLGMVVMFVGIGFLTMLIGAASEQFVARDLQEEAEEIEEELVESDAVMLSALRQVRARLDSLEAALRESRRTLTLRPGAAHRGASRELEQRAFDPLSAVLPGRSPLSRRQRGQGQEAGRAAKLHLRAPETPSRRHTDSSVPRDKTVGVLLPAGAVCLGSAVVLEPPGSRPNRRPILGAPAT